MQILYVYAGIIRKMQAIITPMHLLSVALETKIYFTVVLFRRKRGKIAWSNINIKPQTKFHLACKSLAGKVSKMAIKNSDNRWRQVSMQHFDSI